MQGYQQGDLLLVKVEKLPEGACEAKVAGDRYVLAEGEATGHAHAVLCAPGIEMYERNGTLYLRCAVETEVEHEEHHTQRVAPGVYEVRRVVEVDPFENAVRSVRD